MCMGSQPAPAKPAPPPPPPPPPPEKPPTPIVSAIDSPAKGKKKLSEGTASLRRSSSGLQTSVKNLGSAAVSGLSIL